MWQLIHLRKAKIGKNELAQVYKSTLRSIVEFCSPVYSSMLTAGQEKRLEDIQAKATRIIFGPEKSREERLKEADLEPLSQRRKNRCAKFAKKCIDLERYGHWFPPHQNNCQMQLRTKPRVQELQATTHRRYSSPLFYLRRIMNEPETITETPSTPTQS